MMAITDAAIAAACTGLLFSTSDLTYLALAVVSTQLPDIDSTESVLVRATVALALMSIAVGCRSSWPCWMGDAGGVTGQVNQSLGLRTGAIAWMWLRSR